MRREKVEEGRVGGLVVVLKGGEVGEEKTKEGEVRRGVLVMDGFSGMSALVERKEKPGQGGLDWGATYKISRASGGAGQPVSRETLSGGEVACATAAATTVQPTHSMVYSHTGYQGEVEPEFEKVKISVELRKQDVANVHAMHNAVYGVSWRKRPVYRYI